MCLNIAHQRCINIIDTLLPDALQKAGSLRSTAWNFKRCVRDLLVWVDGFRKDINDLGKDLNDAVEYAVDNVSELEADHMAIIKNMLYRILSQYKNKNFYMYAFMSGLFFY